MEAISKGKILRVSLLALIILVVISAGIVLLRKNKITLPDNLTKLNNQEETTLTDDALKERAEQSHQGTIDSEKQYEVIEPEPEEIENESFKLIGLPNALNFKEALETAQYVASFVEIRPAFLLAVLKEELSLVNEFDLCYLKDFTTGSGVTSEGEAIERVMHPTRDVPGFLEIAQELGQNPTEILITCPMSFGWGGAMGPADFIPSTWLLYKDKIEAITNEPANPWNIRDAFLAAGFYLSESGANSKTKVGEWQAAMIYFSGSTTSPYTWYADGALALADKIETDIKIVEKTQP